MQASIQGIANPLCLAQSPHPYTPPPPPVPSVAAFPVSYPIQFFSPPQGGLPSVPMPLVPSPSVPHTTHAVFLLSSVPLTPSSPVPLRTRAPSVHTPQSPTPISHPIPLIPSPHSVRCSLSPCPPVLTTLKLYTLHCSLNNSILLKTLAPDSF